MAQFLAPHPQLATFIQGYVYNALNFDTKDWHSYYYFTPTHKKFILIYLDNPVYAIHHNAIIEQKENMFIVGPQTKPVSLYFEAQHRMVAIALQPLAQYYLLAQCPLFNLWDTTINAEDVFGNEVKILLEQLQSTFDIGVIKNYLDNFFITKLQSTLISNNQLNQVLNQASLNANVQDLAHAANISIRQLERICKDKIGFTPSMYLRLRRFAAAYNLKSLQPNKTWCDIAHSCGYFDQMHFINDFRLFTGHNPNQLKAIIVNQYRDYTNYE